MSAYNQGPLPPTTSSTHRSSHKRHHHHNRHQQQPGQPGQPGQQPYQQYQSGSTILPPAPPNSMIHPMPQVPLNAQQMAMAMTGIGHPSQQHHQSQPPSQVQSPNSTSSHLSLPAPSVPVYNAASLPSPSTHPTYSYQNMIPYTHHVSGGPSSSTQSSVSRQSSSSYRSTSNSSKQRNSSARSRIPSPFFMNPNQTPLTQNASQMYSSSPDKMPPSPLASPNPNPSNNSGSRRFTPLKTSGSLPSLPDSESNGSVEVYLGAAANGPPSAFFRNSENRMPTPASTTVASSSPRSVSGHVGEVEGTELEMGKRGEDSLPTPTSSDSLHILVSVVALPTPIRSPVPRQMDVDGAEPSDSDDIPDHLASAILKRPPPTSRSPSSRSSSRASNSMRATSGGVGLGVLNQLPSSLRRSPSATSSTYIGGGASGLANLFMTPQSPGLGSPRSASGGVGKDEAAAKGSANE